MTNQSSQATSCTRTREMHRAQKDIRWTGSLVPRISFAAILTLTTSYAVQATAQIDPRSLTPIGLAASGPIGKYDDGWGTCPRFTHFHPSDEQQEKGFRDCFSKKPGKWCNFIFTSGVLRQDGVREAVWRMDGKCHRNSDDSVVIDAKPLLPQSGRRYIF